MNAGLLQCRDVGSWWLGIPGAGVFMKHFTKGRQGILRMLRKRKFKEILQKVARFSTVKITKYFLTRNHGIRIDFFCAKNTCRIT